MTPRWFKPWLKKMTDQGDFPHLNNAAKAVIHGPRDWNHFNEAGYRVLGETLARETDGSASTECVDWDQPR